MKVIDEMDSISFGDDSYLDEEVIVLEELATKESPQKKKTSSI